LTLREQRGATVVVTVVVACRNENPRIVSLLDSLIRLDRSTLDIEVIVADGMSTDGTRRILDDFACDHAWLTVVDNPARIASTGLNRAIRQGRGEFIVRMDAHTVYAPDYVERCVAVLEEHAASNAGGPQRSRAEGFWQRTIHAGFHAPFASGGASFRNDNYCGPADTVPYGCWRKDFLIAIGLFDEGLVRNQDDELNLRTRLGGGIIWQDPSIVSWYSPRSTLSGLFQQYLQFGFWRVAVLRKHPKAATMRHFVPGTAALTGLLLIILSSISRAAAGVLATLGAAYFLLSAWASVRSARREGWDLLPALPLTFAVYQSAYAVGFCAGLVYWAVGRAIRQKVPRLFTEQT
jgi:succinoglycan biosynthesis protein ExoA